MGLTNSSRFRKEVSMSKNWFTTIKFGFHEQLALYWFAVKSYGVLPGNFISSCLMFRSTKVGYHGDILGITVRTV